MKPRSKKSEKERLVGARLPQTLVTDLDRIESVEHSDRSTIIRKLLSRAVSEWKIDYEAKLCLENKVTLEKAAMDAGVSIPEMMDFLKLRKIPLQYDAEYLKNDMESFHSRRAQSKKARSENPLFVEPPSAKKMGRRDDASVRHDLYLYGEK